MKECLYCKEDISKMKDSAKFCSTSCRVMFNRKHGSKDKINPIQMQVLYNQILETVERLCKLASTPYVSPDEILNKPIVAPKTSWDEYLPAQIQNKPPMPFKTLNQYIKERLDMDTPEQYEKWLDELEKDPNLSIKQKGLAKTGRLT